MVEDRDDYKAIRLESAFPTQKSIDEWEHEYRKHESKVTPYFGHKIMTRSGTQDVERQMNEAATVYALMKDALDESTPQGKADARRLRKAVLDKVVAVFYVVGPGVENGVDDLFVDLMGELLMEYDPLKGPYSHFLRFTYSRRTKSGLSKDDERFAKAERYDETEGDSDEGSESGAVRAYNRGRARRERDLGEFASARDGAVGGRDLAEEALVEALVLVIGFLSHRDDSRDHSPERKVYRRVFFTEHMIQWIKVQPSEYACDPFRRHENAIFSAMEIPFLDYCLVEVCRTVLAIWEADLKDGFGVVHREYEHWDGAKWKVPNSKILDYLESQHGMTVGSSALSAHRKKIVEVFESTEAVRHSRSTLKASKARSLK